MKERTTILEWARASWPAFGSFLVVTLSTSGLLVGSLFRLTAVDPLLGAHSAETYSLDLFGLFIPGGHWRFAFLTQPYWSRLPGGINETSVYLGLAASGLLIYVWCSRAHLPVAGVGVWYAVLGLFAVLSLGPHLRVAGSVLPVPLPYRLLEVLFPTISLSGIPERMTIMVILGAAIVSAYGFAMLFAGPPRQKLRGLLWLAVMVIELLPAPVPATSLPPPSFVAELARKPPGGGVLDLSSAGPVALLYQTMYQRPLAFGYISRIPQSIALKDAALGELVRTEQFSQLCQEYDLRYVIRKTDARLIELAPNGTCLDVTHVATLMSAPPASGP